MGGVVKHNLRRVAAGLKGDYLEPEPTPEPEEGEKDQDSSALNGRGGASKKKAAVTEDWQDMSEYEREEGMVEVGEVGDRTNFVQEGGDAESEAMAGQKRSGEGDGKMDKAARKKAKKAKDKEFRAQKEKARAEQSA